MMFHASPFISLVVCVAAFLSLLPFPRTVKAQDLVATEDISGGSSVFVFRESRKKPQAHAKGAGATFGVSARARGARANTQIASAAQTRRATAMSRKRETVAKANRKAILSNTLATNADAFLDKGQTDQAITNYRAAL